MIDLRIIVAALFWATPVLAQDTFAEFEQRCLLPMIEMRETDVTGLLRVQEPLSFETWEPEPDSFDWIFRRNVPTQRPVYCRVIVYNPRLDFDPDQIAEWVEAAVASGNFEITRQEPLTLVSSDGRMPRIEVEYDDPLPTLTVLELAPGEASGDEGRQIIESSLRAAISLGGGLQSAVVLSMADGHGRMVDAEWFVAMAKECTAAVVGGLPVPNVIPQGDLMLGRNDTEAFHIDLGPEAEEQNISGFFVRNVQTRAVTRCWMDYELREETAEYDRTTIAEIERQIVEWQAAHPVSQHPRPAELRIDPATLLCGPGGGAWVGLENSGRPGVLAFRVYPIDDSAECDGG